MTSKILVVEDHPLMQRALVSLLEDEFVGATVVCASTADEGLRLARSERYDLIVFDLHGTGGQEGLQSFLTDHPSARVLVHTALQAPHHGVDALRAGALGVVYKSSPPQHLLRALHRVAGGQATIPQRLASALQVREVVPSSLSRREQQVGRALVGGHRPARIAADLGLSVKTVSTYRARILQKLGVSNLPDLVRAWERFGL